MTENQRVELRPGQKFAIPQIVSAFKEGKEVVVLHAPTGSGKSLLAMEVANEIAKRTFVTSTQVSLVAQYANDPNLRVLSPESVTLTGKKNYPCHRDALLIERRRLSRPVIDAAEATCYELDELGQIRKDDDGGPIPCRYKRWERDTGELPECEYYRKKAEAELSPAAVTTLAYYFYGVSEDHLMERGPPTAEEPKGPKIPGTYRPAIGFFHGRLSARPILIVDEAHALESEVIRYLTTKWTEDQFNSPAYSAAFRDFTEHPASIPIRETHDPTDEDRIHAVETFQDHIKPILIVFRQSKDPRERQVLERIEQGLDALSTVADDIANGIPWVVRLHSRKTRRHIEPVRTFEVTPVVAAPHLKKRLFAKSERILLMSGSFFGTRSTLQDLGLLGRPAREVTIRSVFPPENGPIFKIPVATLNFQNRETEFPKVLQAVDRLLEVEHGRGIVHAQSFSNVELIEAAVRPEFKERLWLHRRDTDREELIADFRTKSEPGAVLVSPSITEGLDLPGEMGEWCAFVKAPFASKRDERIALRVAMPDGERWYERQAVAKTIQGRGRILRSEDDRGRTYLFDANHIKLLNRWREDLPKWFVESLDIGERVIDLGVRAYLMGETKKFVPEDPTKYPKAPPRPSKSESKGIDFAALLDKEKRAMIKAQNAIL